MNNDLISRSKVIEELNYLKHIGYDNSGVMKLQNMEIQRCISVIEDAPTALFPLTVQIVDEITDESIELLKQILKDYNPQILNLETERPQGEYTEEDIKQAIKENFELGYEMFKTKVIGIFNKYDVLVLHIGNKLEPVRNTSKQDCYNLIYDLGELIEWRRLLFKKYHTVEGGDDNG